MNDINLHAEGAVAQVEPKPADPMPTNWRITQPDSKHAYLIIKGDVPSYAGFEEEEVCIIYNPHFRGNPQHVIVNAVRFLEAIEKAQAALDRVFTPGLGDKTLSPADGLMSLLSILSVDPELVKAVKAARGEA